MARLPYHKKKRNTITTIKISTYPLCGINFILDKKKRLSSTPILRMNEALLHRGRENSAWHCHIEEDRQLFFGHNRLKIIDIQDRANQPMRSPDGRYILVFNGEIYNFRELKKPLQTSYDFYTESDTEVLLYSLAYHQAEEIPHLLNGIYAYIWYDTQEKRLQIARDTFGVKPLYKYEDDNYLILSSEIRGILATGLVGKVLDEAQIYHYLTYRYAEPDKTFFKDIVPWKIYHGTFAHHHSNFPPPQPSPPPLSSALARQTVADVPFGLFLSGGVDSTLLLAILYEMGYENLPAFTIANKETEKNFGTEDFYYAQLASQQYKAKLNVLEIDSTILKDLPAFVQTVDQPIGDGAYWLTQMLSKEARKQVKFVLSGAGADELFAGYNRHQAFYYYEKYYALFCLAYPFLKIGGKILPTGFAHPFRKQFRLLKKFADSLHYTKDKTWENFIRLCAFPTHSDIKSGRQDYGLWHDQEYYLQNDILPLTDRAGMQHELEIRVPYLDNEIVKYANSLSWEYRLKKGKKWLLKEQLEARAGKVYTQRRKEGFGMPIGKWLRETVGKDFIAVLQSKDCILKNYIDTNWLHNLMKQHLAQKQDYSSELWAILLLEMWLQEHF
jgi:asparagine synthase (glutamine-hydrolysing)